MSTICTENHHANIAPLALVWDNFGPLHDDRLRACVAAFGPEVVVGVEINGRSNIYSWDNAREGDLPKVTLFPDAALSEVSDFAMARAIHACLVRQKAQTVFLCHYERLGTWLLAVWLRLTGRRVFVMGCPKFDDRPRSAAKEFVKQLFMAPYQGALVGGPGTQAYFEFLGLRGKPMARGYNTVSNARIRALAGVTGERSDAPFDVREFVMVARLVPKKNLATAIRAYAAYSKACGPKARRLHICGDGPLEGELRALASELGVAKQVVFHGFVQSDEVAKILARALALVLVSVEEQFGNVVPEALALGVPVILSDVCGARYELLQSGVNGFLVEAENVEGIAAALTRMAEDEGAWRRLSDGAVARAPLGDAARFAEGVAALVA